MDIKYFICPMSKNIVDSVISLDSPMFGLLPSRRQIEYNGGYVNNWTTKTFSEYVQNNSKIIIERDHAGKGQGDCDEYTSYQHDSKYFDIIHIDPWKNYENLEDGINETLENIRFIYKENSAIKFEVCTEEALKKIELDELGYILIKLKENLTPEEFENILYVAIQSGVGLDLFKGKNIGIFNLDRFKGMVKLCEKFQKKSKEHNGDFLKGDEIKIRFDNGLDCLNIGPEMAQIETKILLDNMNNEDINNFYEVCYKSKKWEKWLKNNSEITDKESLIMACGHYSYNNYDFISLNKSKINNIIVGEIKVKLKELLSYV